MKEIGKKCENLGNLTAVRRIKKTDNIRNLSGPCPTTQSKRCLFSMRLLNCTLVWIRCLFDFFNFEFFWT